MYNTLNPKYGYNIAIVNEDGTTSVSDSTKAKLSAITKKMWEEGKFDNSNKIGKPSWNKGLKCDNISLSRRNMFFAVEVYNNDVLIATFRSVTDLSEWTKNNELPGLQYYSRKYYNNTFVVFCQLFFASFLQNFHQNLLIQDFLQINLNI